MVARWEATRQRREWKKELEKEYYEKTAALSAASSRKLSLKTHAHVDDAMRAWLKDVLHYVSFINSLANVQSFKFYKTF